MNASNLSTVPQLKALFIKAANLQGVEPAHLRLFYGGKELNNEFSLYQYHVADDMVVQAMIKKI